MKKLEAFIQAFMLDDVKQALSEIGFKTMTTSDVLSHGGPEGQKGIYRGQEYKVDLLPKIQIEVVVEDRLSDQVVEAIIQAARTGEIGDGRVFVLPVTRGYRIRTGELDAS